jgi:hypothetical protein
VAVAILSLAGATGALVKIFLFFQRHQFLAKVLNFSSRIGTPPIAGGQGTGGLSNFLQQTQEKPIIRDSVTISSKERWYEKLWKKAGTIARKSGSAIKMAGRAAGRVGKGIWTILLEEVNDPSLSAGGPTYDPDDYIPVYHASINDASKIRQNGLDVTKTPTWASRDIAAAQNAISSERFEVANGLARDVGIIESRIPKGIFEKIFLPSERPYYGFGGKIISTEIVLRSQEQILNFNRYIVR